MLKRLQLTGHWPFGRAGEWRTMYEQQYKVRLATTDEAYKKLKRLVENAKAKYKKEHPDAE